MKRLEQYDAFEIPLKDILYDESFNCRGKFTIQSITELAGSIKDIGLQFPVAVQPWEDRFRLLAGHRRFKAVETLLKWETIPAIVFKGLNEHQARLLNFTENLERKDLTIMEEARALDALYPDGISLRKASKELKRPTRWIHIRIRLLNLPDKVQMKAALGLLSAVNIEAICQLPEDKQIAAAESIVQFKEMKSKKGTRRSIPVSRSFRHKKTKAQLSKMTAVLINAGVNGLPPRLMAWAAGYLSDAKIKKDIKRHAPEYEFGSSGESPFRWEDSDQQVSIVRDLDG